MESDEIVDTLDGERVNETGKLLVDRADVEEGVAVVLNSLGRGLPWSDVVGDNDGLRKDVSKEISTGSGKTSEWIDGEGRRKEGS